MKWKKSNNILVLLWKQFCPCGPLEGVLGIPMGPQTTLWKAMLSAMVVQGWSPGPLYQHHLGTCQKCKFSGFKPQTYRLRTCGRWSPTIWVLSSPASDSDAHWGLRTTVLYLTEGGRATGEKHQWGGRKKCFHSMQNLVVISINEKLETKCRKRKN